MDDHDTGILVSMVQYNDNPGLVYIDDHGSGILVSMVTV